MPIIASAKKKMRQDVKRTRTNMRVREIIRSAIKAMRLEPTEKHLREVFKVLDISAKKNILHKNKAARLKSTLSKLLQSKDIKKTLASPKKETRKKTPRKKTK